jgi:hypothetical protein
MFSTKDFEDDKSTTVEKDEFDDLRGCGLGDEDDDDASEVEKPPAMPEDSDEEDMTQIDPLVQEVELEEASVALSAAYAYSVTMMMAGVPYQVPDKCF